MGRPILGSDAKRVCAMTGMNREIHVQKIVTLKKLREGIKQSLVEATAAASDERKYTVLLVGAKMAKAACDVAIDVVGSKLGIPGMIVGVIYEQATMVVDALNGSITKDSLKDLGRNKSLDILSKTATGYGKEGLAKSVDRAKTLVNAAKAIDDIVETAEEGRTGASGIEGAARTLEAMLRDLNGKIFELEMALADCDRAGLA